MRWCSVCPTLCNLMNCSPTRLLCPWNSPGKNTGVGFHALLQGIFPTQGLNPHLLHLLHWQVGFFATVPTGFTATYESAHSEGQDQNQEAEVTWNQNCPHKVKPPARRWNWCSRLRVKGQTPIHDSRKLAMHHPHSCPLLIPFTVSQPWFFPYFYPQTPPSSHPSVLRLPLLYNLSGHSSTEYF